MGVLFLDLFSFILAFEWESFSDVSTMYGGGEKSTSTHLCQAQILGVYDSPPQ